MPFNGPLHFNFRLWPGSISADSHSSLAIPSQHTTPILPTIEGLKNALATVQTPDLRSYLPDQPTAGTRPNTQAVQRFQDDKPRFAAFKKTMHGVFLQLYKTTATIESSAYANSNWAFLERKMGLGPLGEREINETFHSELFLMYQETCKQLIELSIMAQWATDPKTPLDDNQLGSFIKSLADIAKFDITVCGPGVITNIASQHKAALNALLPVPFKERFEQHRTVIARNIIAHHTELAYSSRGQQFLRNNHIHIVNAVQKALAQKFKLLEPPEDKYAARSFFQDLNDFQLNRLQRALELSISNGAIATSLANEVLQEFSLRCDTTQADWNHGFNDVRAALSAQYGEINPFSVCIVDPETQIPIGIQHNPTLLAIDFLKSAEVFAPIKTGLGKHLLTQQHDSIYKQDNLIWIKRRLSHGEAEHHLLEFHQLNAQPLENFLRTPNRINTVLVTSILHECFRNIDLPITQVFRQVNQNQEEPLFWLNCIRMTILNWPDNLPKPYRVSPWALSCSGHTDSYNQQLFAISLTCTKLETWFDVAHFKKALQAMPVFIRSFVQIMEQEFEPNGIEVSSLLEIKTGPRSLIYNDNMKSFEAALSLFKNDANYNAEQTLSNAIIAKNCKAIELVLTHWPDELPYPNHEKISDILKTVITLKPSETLVKLLIDHGSAYPPYAELNAQSPEPNLSYGDLLSLAVKQNWVNALDAMMNKNCLPAGWESHHMSLMMTAISGRGHLKLREKTALKLLDIQDRLGHQPAFRTSLSYFANAKVHELPILAAELLKRSKQLNVINDNGYTHLQEAVLADKPALVQALVLAGANINMFASKAHVGKTALHLAYRANNMAMVTVLESLGANPLAKDMKGRLPHDLKPAQTSNSSNTTWLSKLNLRPMR